MTSQEKARNKEIEFGRVICTAVADSIHDILA